FRLGAADPLEYALLKDAQQLDLHVEAHVPDLVEEQCAAVRELEASGARADGAGERTFLMAEQLGFEQVARDRTAVDRNERSGSAFRQLVNAPRDELLAAPRFARSEEHTSELQSR